MSTLTITEFLEARIAEDEAVARLVVDLFEESSTDRIEVYSEATGYFERLPGAARVLAECAAKRAIIAEHQQDHLGAVCTRCRFIGGYMEYPCQTLEALAAVYADHPDYRQEWKL